MGSIQKMVGTRGTTYKAIVRMKGVTKALRFGTKEEALQWILDTEHLLKTGVVPIRGVLMEQAISEYQKTLPLCECHHPSVYYFVSNRLKKLIGHLKSDKVTLNDVKEYLDNYRIGHKPATVYMECSGIYLVGKFCVEKGYMQNNPFKGIVPKDKGEPRTRIPTEPEIKALWKAVKTPGDKFTMLLFCFCCETGMRNGEARKIQESWIQGRVVSLPAVITKTRSARKVGLSSKALNLLDQAREFNLDPIFKMTSRQYDSHWKRLKSRAGIVDLHFHDSRAYFCTQAVKKGIDPMTLARQTGHKSISMLMRYYRPNAEDIARMLDL